MSSAASMLKKLLVLLTFKRIHLAKCVYQIRLLKARKQKMNGRRKTKDCGLDLKATNVLINVVHPTISLALCKWETTATQYQLTKSSC